MLWLLQTLGLEGQNALPIYIGDDGTDGDAFCALEKQGIGILVSEKPHITAASYSLKNPDEVERFLGELIAHRLDR
jgi:trehalose-6-phosphatase